VFQEAGGHHPRELLSLNPSAVRIAALTNIPNHEDIVEMTHPVHLGVPLGHEPMKHLCFGSFGARATTSVPKGVFEGLMLAVVDVHELLPG
jgi:hypothetical protein